MTYTEIAKLLMSGEKIFNIPLKVCFYARVSTESDVQLNSLNNQESYYKNYIKSKVNWTYIDGYVDEGISGVRVENREAFKKMIRDAKAGKFDLIITKEVSRFARDLEDSIHYIRKLKDADVGVFFENQNLNTFDANSEMILNIMFNLAQDESRKLSGRVKFGHKQAIEKGHVLGSSNIMGYKKYKCRLIIIEEEAKFIEKLFELYATGEYGFYKLAKKLGSLGYFNKKGHLYDKDSLKRMISNPKYKGYYRGYTTETIDYRTKKRQKINKENQILYKCTDGTVPAIVSEELWDRANSILKTRTKAYSNHNYYTGSLKYPFSSKIYCKDCNVNFGRSHGNRKKNRPTWCCGNYLQYRLDACASSIICESDLYHIMNLIMAKILPDKKEIINSMLDLYNSIDKTTDYERELDNINKDIKGLEDKKAFALDMVFKGDITKETLKNQLNRFENNIEQLNNKKNQILKQIDILKQRNDNIDKMTKVIEKELKGGAIEEFIRQFVDEIIVTKINNNRYDIKLDIYLNLFGLEKAKIKGAKHINGPFENEILYIENQTINSLENSIRKSQNRNKFTYNIYIDSL